MYQRCRKRISEQRGQRRNEELVPRDFQIPMNTPYIQEKAEEIKREFLLFTERNNRSSWAEILKNLLTTALSDIRNQTLDELARRVECMRREEDWRKIVEDYFASDKVMRAERNRIFNIPLDTILSEIAEMKKLLN